MRDERMYRSIGLSRAARIACPNAVELRPICNQSHLQDSAYDVIDIWRPYRSKLIVLSLPLGPIVGVFRVTIIDAAMSQRYRQDLRVDERHSKAQSVVSYASEPTDDTTYGKATDTGCPLRAIVSVAKGATHQNFARD